MLRQFLQQLLFALRLQRRDDGIRRKQIGDFHDDLLVGDQAPTPLGGLAFS